MTTNTLEFPYSRTLGPVVGAFFAGLRERRLLAARTASGRVLFPPLEYDPDTGDALAGELVAVGPEATVESWTWVTALTPKHPLDHPFAFALIKPDGADTATVHAVDAGSIENMSTGMRVRPRWRVEARNRVDDIECWVAAS